LARHPWVTRAFWPWWFAHDNVFPSADHLPYLRRRFETVSLDQRRAKVPYLPWARVPYYRFVGRKPG
jgi:S-adenosylmethionine-diacylgycerolhomoserine-N-methlytransferase